MIYPLKGIGTIPGIYLTQVFGVNPAYYAKYGLKGHNGIDWGCPSGTPVLATLDGDLGFAADDQVTAGKGYGLNARLFSPYKNNQGASRIEMLFGHLEKYSFNAGLVKQGSIIGWTDNTGDSSGPHLHFGIRLWNDSGIINYGNGYLGWIDPLPFLEGQIMENQAKIVKSKTSPQVWWCYAMPDMDYLKKKADTEGKEIPDPIPDTDSL